MRGNVEAIKERLDIAEVLGSYLTLVKAGVNFKAKCPFHNEKTPSFFISTARQSYYCFGCGEKGDIFTFVEKMEGVDFKSALKTLAEKAGVELVYEKGENKTDKDKLYAVLEDATLFFENNLNQSGEAKKYLLERGLSEESLKHWRLGFAPDEWRLLSSHLKSLGYDEATLIKAGLIKRPDDSSGKEPYDVFRGRLIFPLADQAGKVIAFSGRALSPDAVPKYLNSPDTALFTKSEVLYGLDKAKEDIRKKDYVVLVEGQMDLVLSHQAGVKNTVASSGTAFTQMHLERLKRLSARIILAFDGDLAGKKAAEKSSALALALGLEPKVATLPEGKDPADLVRDNPEKWKDVLRESKHAIEVFLSDIVETEKDHRKVGKAIEKKILPLVMLLGSSIERAHFVSVIGKRSGIREEIIWEDLRKVKALDLLRPEKQVEKNAEAKKSESIWNIREERLANIVLWIQENPEPSTELEEKKKEEIEIRNLLLQFAREAERDELIAKLRRGEEDEETMLRIQTISRQIDEEKRKVAQ
jgi:DNA primase